MTHGNRELRLGIVGGGRAAWAWGNSWQQAGGTVASVALRPESTSRLDEWLSVPRVGLGEASNCDLLLVAVNDAAIADVARALLPAVRDRGVALFHSSGSLSSAVFDGYPLGFSLHPLRALPLAPLAVSLRDTLLVFEGPDEAEGIARQVSAAVGGEFARIDAAGKRRYHAGAVFAANHVAAVLEIAEQLMREAGVDSPGLRTRLADLARSAVANWETGGAARFTGPVARVDSAVVEGHRRELEDDPERAELYRRLSVVIARALAAEAPSEDRQKLLEKLLN